MCCQITIKLSRKAKGELYDPCEELGSNKFLACAHLAIIAACQRDYLVIHEPLDEEIVIVCVVDISIARIDMTQYFGALCFAIVDERAINTIKCHSQLSLDFVSSAKSGTQLPVLACSDLQILGKNFTVFKRRPAWTEPIATAFASKNICFALLHTG